MLPSRLTTLAPRQKKTNNDWFKPTLNLRHTLRRIFVIAAVLSLPYIVRSALRWWGFDLVAPVSGFIDKHYLYVVLSMSIGAAVGASEIVSRYRDEPYLAVISPPGRSYLLLNAGLSAAAYGLLYRYKESLFPGLVTDNNLLMASIIAGLGAMVIMRTKLFNLKTEEGETFAVGPDAVVSIYLNSVDRQIDRFRSSARQALIYDEMVTITDPVQAPQFLRVFLTAYQNLSDTEKKTLDSDITGVLNRTDIDAQLKLMAIGFGFLNISGDNNFRELISQLRKYQTFLKEKATRPGAAQPGGQTPITQPPAPSSPPDSPPYFSPDSPPDSPIDSPPESPPD